MSQYPSQSPAELPSSNICRVALISTPRSGNTWVTNMVARAFELKEQWVHSPSDIDWDNLPDRVVLQLHWQRTPDFVEKLRAHGFHVVVMSRHPLDVLISILVYCQHDSSTLNWLNGAGGDERSLSGAYPLSDPFLNYAIGARAAALLGVSQEWWNHSDVCPVRYEDLLEDTFSQMRRVVASIGQPLRVPLEDVIEEFRPSATRQKSVQFLFHVWSAQAGLWRQLLTSDFARRIHEVHRNIFDTLGYECRPDETLNSATAQTTWEKLDFAGLKRNVNGLKRRMQECELQEKADVINLHKELHRLDVRTAEDAQRIGLRLEETRCLHHQLADVMGNVVARLDLLQNAMQSELAQVQAERDQLVETVHLMQTRLETLDGLAPWSIKTAQKLQVWFRRFPTFSAAMKSIAKRFSHRESIANSQSTVHAGHGAD